MRAHQWSLAAAAMIVLVGLVGCSSPSDEASTRLLGALTGPTTTTAAPTTTTTAPSNCDPRAGFAPDPNLPTPTVAAIQQRGKLVVGVDQGTLNWGYRDPRDGTIRGLDVDILRQIAIAIFGSNNDDDHLEFKTLTTAGRIAAVKAGDVDMVASLLTATCARWNDVNFSTDYYDAHQDVLVPVDSPVHKVSALAGKTVCATRGSTSITNIKRLVRTAKIYPVDTRADCLVALQDGQVDAITSDDTILKSFQAQEETNPSPTRLLGQPLEPEPYAIAIAKGKEDLLRFVNGQLGRMRTDGTLEGLYQYWLKSDAPPAPPAPNETR